MGEEDGGTLTNLKSDKESRKAPASSFAERLSGSGERVLQRIVFFVFMCFFHGFHYFERDKTVSLNDKKMVTRIIFGRIWSEVILFIID